MVHLLPSVLFFFFSAIASPSTSPDLHYNEALQQSRSGNFETASESLLKSISVEPNPFVLWEDLSLLETFQRRLGIQESATRGTLSRISLFSNQTLHTLTLLFLFWLGVAYCYLRFRHGRKRPALLFVAASVAVFFILDLAVGYQAGSFGILTSNGDKEIAVFRSGDLAESIISLPPGTVVAGKTVGNSFQMREPVSGWVPKEKFVPIVAHPFQ